MLLKALPPYPTTVKCLTILSILLGFLVTPTFSIPINAAASVVCGPTTWSDVLLFFLVNYIAHAATVPSSAGAKWYDSCIWTVVCLLLPFAGLGRSIALVIRHMEHRGSDVEKALARGALVVVSRSRDWKPVAHEDLVYMKLPEHCRPGESAAAAASISAQIEVPDNAITVNLRRMSVHGRVVLPDGYKLAFADVDDLNRWNLDLEHARKITLCRSQSWVKMAVSIAQVIYSSITLYRARGQQIDRYGYAAFGLSVFQYAFMSAVNFICVHLIGEYPCLYILRTPVLHEAERREGVFDGAIGRVKDEGSTDGAGSDWDGAHNDRNRGTDSDTPYTAVWVSLQVQTAEESEKSIPEEETLVVRVAENTRRFKLVSDPGNHKVFRVSSGVSSDIRIRSGQAGDPLSFIRDRLPQARRLVEDRSTDAIMAFVALYVLMSAMSVVAILVMALPHLVIFFLSGFKEAHSTTAQRAWMMAWLCSSQTCFVYMCLQFIRSPHISIFAADSDLAEFSGELLFALAFYAIPAFGGFVTVGKMLMEFGTCSLSP